ncbi:MAG: ADP-ribosylglycohydrolase family protein, partial [Acutalibacteraceae bacterium]|nr:ADP-ribosylglycohydrolase family protein [Acutalibacteraceae bacterium]
MFAKIYDTEIKIDHNHVEGFNRYASDIMAEYNQSIEEGLDIEKHKALFESVAAMRSGEMKTKLSELIFETVINSKIRSGYKYNEPNDLDKIKALREAYDFKVTAPDSETLRKKLFGAWTGRACGCLLGKPVEGIRSEEFIPLLKETGNYPMHRYI